MPSQSPEIHHNNTVKCRSIAGVGVGVGVGGGGWGVKFEENLNPVNILSVLILFVN